jgi:HEPN domain-containing protein
MKQITKDWLETASLDLESIPLLIKHDRLTGHVAFHAQQAIEKTLKATIEEYGGRVPKIHSLSKLFDLCGAYISIPIDDDIIIALDSLYIESRYPGEFGLLPEGKPNQKQAQRFYEFAQEIYETVKHHLETRK